MGCFGAHGGGVFIAVVPTITRFQVPGPLEVAPLLLARADDDERGCEESGGFFFFFFFFFFPHKRGFRVFLSLWNPLSGALHLGVFFFSPAISHSADIWVVVTFPVPLALHDPFAVWASVFFLDFCPGVLSLYSPGQKRWREKQAQGWTQISFRLVSSTRGLFG